MKKKGAGMVMPIILISVCGWVAVVGLVIKPAFWVGALLSIGGGVVIGTIVAYLIRRCWLKRIPSIPLWDTERVTSHKLYPLGTSFQRGPMRRRYACAGEDLKAGTMVEASLAGRVLNGQGITVRKELNELIYGDVKAAPQVDKLGTNLLGWPTVNVRKGQHFWIQEPPMGAEFEKEGDDD